jgi:hypothetical protein
MKRIGSGVDDEDGGGGTFFQAPSPDDATGRSGRRHSSAHASIRRAIPSGALTRAIPRERAA